MPNHRKKIALLVGVLAVVIVSVVGLPFGQFGFESRSSRAYEAYNNLGQVIFLVSKPTFLYDGPGGTATPYLIPVDADHNGFDSYIVWKCEYVGDDLWLGLFVGDELQPAWVPFTSISGINPDYPFNPAICPA